MAISKEEVLHVARLARLALTDEEVERLTGARRDPRRSGVVAEADLAEVPPTSHPLDLVNVCGTSDLRPSLDEVFANAPERDGDLFRVPPVGE